MKRRTFIAGLGSAAALPVVARAQQAGMPVVGFLDTGARAASSAREAAFREGLGSMGFVEGRNVAINYQYTEAQNNRLPALAAELVRQQVAAIYASGAGPAVTAKAATSTIPIVFGTGGDPIKLGLVTSLNQPGGNMTGVSFLTTATAAIRMQMLHEAVPKAALMGLLVKPIRPRSRTPERCRTPHANLGLSFKWWAPAMRQISTWPLRRLCKNARKHWSLTATLSSPTGASNLPP